MKAKCGHDQHTPVKPDPGLRDRQDRQVVPLDGAMIRNHLVTLFLLFLPLATGQAAVGLPGAHETIIAGDYFGVGMNASPDSAVDGDAFIAGAQVVLNKPVTGDALLAGGGVSVADRIGGQRQEQQE